MIQLEPLHDRVAIKGAEELAIAQPRASAASQSIMAPR